MAFVLDIALSLKRMLIGYCWVVLIGITLGLIFGRSNLLHRTFGTLVVALQSLPGIVWVPVATYFFGLTETAVIFTIVLGGTGIVIVNTDSGVRQVSPIFVHAGRVMGARGINLFWYVIVPAAIPKILDGLRLAWAFGWRALMAGELIISVGGFGRRINNVVASHNASDLIILITTIGIIGFVVDGLIFKHIERNIQKKWGLA